MIVKRNQKNIKAVNEEQTNNQGFTRKEEVNRLRGVTKIIDPERGPKNK